MKSSTSFKPGQSGNPNGKPPGGFTHAEFQRLVKPHLPDIVQALVKKAKNGNIEAIKLLVERFPSAAKSIEK